MKTRFVLLMLYFTVSCFTLLSQKILRLDCKIDAVTNSDTFIVRAVVSGKLHPGPIVYNFVGTVPGTYQIMNIGRLVNDFKAIDKSGNLIPSKKISVNQYEISHAGNLHFITYKVGETFSSVEDSLPIALMAGSVIEKNYVLLNPHTVIGYFGGFRNADYRLQLLCSKQWKIGTAMKKRNANYVSGGFDKLIDNSILAGKLSYSDTIISGTKIKVFCFSEQEMFTAKMLLSNLSGVLVAAKNFIGAFPVKQYTFLYCFPSLVSGQTGAWEHSYSSLYLLNDLSRGSASDEIKSYLETLRTVSGHEFLHILTPLHLHSEVIDRFNFSHPVSSMHLWLYEGVTEWASLMMLFRDGLIPLDFYLSNGIRWKIQGSEMFFKSQWSLKKISDSVYSITGNKKYGDVYLKGSIVASCLDIRLLELSHGKCGLRELILQLVQKYKSTPFDEYAFFDEIVSLTYPEIRQFIDDYIIEGKTIPYNEILGKIGLKLERAEDEISGLQYRVTQLAQITPKQQHLFEAWKTNSPIKP